MKNIIINYIVIACYLLLETSIIHGAVSEKEVGLNNNSSRKKINISNQPKPADVRTVNDAINMAELYFKKAFNSDDSTQQEIHFQQAVEYFKKADDILKMEKAEVLLKEGWLMRRYSLRLDDAIKMIENGLELSPNNPVAYYKLASLKLDKYFSSLPTFTEKPQRTKKMPDGNVIHLEPEYVVYSEENDNALLEEAQRLAEKAIKIDPTFANAYHLLSKVHVFKKEREKASIYDYLLLKNKAELNMELLYYNEKAKTNLLKAAESRLKHRAPEKYQELIGEIAK